MSRAHAAVALAAAVLLVVVAGAPASSTDPRGRRTFMLGRSVDGRPITAVETGDFDASRRILVVGCIHGNEQAGLAIAERLAQSPAPRELDLWVVPVLNPDGVAADIRGNADQVDLNRNFPWRWRPLGGIYDSGPHPLSEPETRIAERLIRRIQPDVAIWFHQHLRAVDDSGGNVGLERRFARMVGLPLASLTREPGSAVGWENHELPSGTAFVVELPAGRLSSAAVTRYAHAVISVLPEW